MKLSDSLYLLVWLLFFSTTGHSQADRASIEKLMRVSGVVAQIENFSALIKKQLLQTGELFTGEKLDERSSSLAHVFESELILATIAEGLSKEMNDDEIVELIRWYTSKPGLLVVEADGQAFTKKAHQEMKSMATALMSDVERMEVAKRVVKAGNLKERMTAFQKSISLVMLKALERSRDFAVPMDPAFFEGIIDAQMAAMDAKIERQALVYALYSYRQLDIETLNEYEAALRTPAMNKFKLLGTQQLGLAIENRMDQLIEP